MTASSLRFSPTPLRRSVVLATAALLLAGLPACSMLGLGGSNAPEPQALPANPAQVGAISAWRTNVGALGETTGAQVQQGQLLISNAAGEVLALNAKGEILSRNAFNQPLLTAPGFDGTRVAAVTQNSELMVLAAGKVLWRQRLPAQSYTAPVVAGGRVFVLLADRSIMAFDGDTGGKLWQVLRSTSGQAQEALSLRQAGVLLPVGDTLVAGVGHFLQGLNPDNGRPVWSKAVANPRSTNDVERLSDLVAPAYRDGSTVCARSYQVGLACVNTQNTELLWGKPNQGQTGLGGNAQAVFSSDSDGRVRAWSRERGLPLWVNEQFLLRHLSNPTAIGSHVALGDAQGRMYFLQAADGSLQEYQNTDGAAVQNTLLFAGQLVSISRAGGVFAWRLP